MKFRTPVAISVTWGMIAALFMGAGLGTAAGVTYYRHHWLHRPKSVVMFYECDTYKGTATVDGVGNVLITDENDVDETSMTVLAKALNVRVQEVRMCVTDDQPEMQEDTGERIHINYKNQ